MVESGIAMRNYVFFWKFSLISVFIFAGFSQLAVLVLKSHIFLSLRADFCRCKACASLFLLLQVWLPLGFHKVYSILRRCRLSWLPPLCWGAKPQQLCFCLYLLWLSLWNWQGFFQLFVILLCTHWVLNFNTHNDSGIIYFCLFNFSQLGLSLSKEAP